MTLKKIIASITLLFRDSILTRNAIRAILKRYAYMTQWRVNG